MPNLQELTLGFGRLDDIPSTLDTKATPRLRALTLYSVTFSDKAFNAFFQWTLGLRQLRCVLCSAISFERHRLLTLNTVLRHWIVINGVTSAGFVYNTLDEVQVIASVLQNAPRSLPLTFLDVDDIGNDVACLWKLIKSMAHLVNTTVKFEFKMHECQYRAIKTTALEDHGVDVPSGWRL
ncbi:hypothetical protein SDRG_08034 [Saprolegnia diclina VS20]|uniref:F-box domain-containing protein n=1 Tax=Saprolegnia diclina (strain VS20) TaxID=1156394 RepID=T0RV49_SAPDV|nr:hypothetical protein SDRG_08034 [Saprolegnia diclina VS20]EQC34262.1 hypothetical protein SDRG_08034 [Saprolegnia diclina VS20]|eukprot:XP_008612124.1 hypothetical protein SDRG_08034 [Saprolegnia diclina VS20]